jgi:serine protease AprX
MAAGLVSGAVALMLSQDPTLTPDTVKARLMRSARKIAGDPTATGAGVLDVTGALNDTGRVYTPALSPIMARSQDGQAILVEDTALLWGDNQWSAAYLWANGYLWANEFAQADGYVGSDAYLWANGYLWANAYLWANGSLSSDAYLWANGYLWANAYLWANVVGSDSNGASSATTRKSD